MTVIGIFAALAIPPFHMNFFMLPLRDVRQKH
jgi:hypothetical protein